MGEVAPLEDVYCTLCLSDSYLPGAAVLAKSLRDAGTQKKLACIVVQANLRHSVMTELQSLFNYVISVDAIGNPHPANLYLMGRPDLQFTFTKVHLWGQTQFRKIVYVDSDVVALRAPDELFDLPDSFAAASDVGWPDAFNSGVMVLTPNMGEYSELRSMADAGDSFDGGDQGLFNQYFEHRPWKRLSFTYNCTPNGYYQYEPAYRYYKHRISMVHFIGPEKPWVRGRTAEGSPGAFQELLDRWWTTYDRHFKVSTTDYVYGQRELGSHVIQQGVYERGKTQEKSYYATGYPIDATGPAPPPEAQAFSTEALLTDPEDVADSLDHGHTDPQRTADVRRFSAPTVEWDATRGAPPPQSRPEAATLAVQNYEFTHNPEPFRPPESYPAPPKDMWYEVPTAPVKSKEEKLPPLFPWEEHDRPAPTRKFVDDGPSTPPSGDPEFRGGDEFEVQMDTDVVEPKTPTIRINDQTPWSALGAINRNAWDDVSGIENYVRALTAHQRSRGKVQVVYQGSQASSSQEAVTASASATAAAAAVIAGAAEISPTQLVNEVQKRRESLILTDFPTAVDRPSLPVTPAPIRRTTFWGPDEKGEDEQNTSGTSNTGAVGATAAVGDSTAAPGTARMPPAEGVPHQADWNPNAQLEQLRRNSLLVGPEDLRGLAQNAIPERGLPTTASVPAVTSPPASAERSLSMDGSTDLASNITAQAIGSAIGATTGGYTSTERTTSSQTHGSSVNTDSSRSPIIGTTAAITGAAAAAATVGLGLGLTSDERHTSSTTTMTGSETTYDQRGSFDQRESYEQRESYDQRVSSEQSEAFDQREAFGQRESLEGRHVEGTTLQRDSFEGGSAEVTPRQENRQFFETFESDSRGSAEIADTSRFISSETFTGGSNSYDSRNLSNTVGLTGTTETFTGGSETYQSRNFSNTAESARTSEMADTFGSAVTSRDMGSSFVESSPANNGVLQESSFNIRNDLESMNERSSNQFNSSYENGLGFREVQFGEESSSLRREEDSTMVEDNTLRGDSFRQVDISQSGISGTDSSAQQRFDSSLQTSNSAIDMLQDERLNQQQLLQTEEGYSASREEEIEARGEAVQEEASQNQSQSQSQIQTETETSGQETSGGSGMFRSYIVPSSSSASQISESSSTGSWES